MSMVLIDKLLSLLTFISHLKWNHKKLKFADLLINHGVGIQIGVPAGHVTSPEIGPRAQGQLIICHDLL